MRNVKCGDMIQSLQYLFYHFSILLFCVGVINCTQLFAQTFYIAPTGNDAAVGTETAPFATLERARDAARAARNTASITIVLRGGIYYQPKTFTLTPEDSNTIFIAYESEKPIISGGKEIKGAWQKEGDLLYTDLGNPLNYTFKNLYVGNQTRQRARHPNLSETEPNQMFYRNGLVQGHGRNAFSFKENDVKQYENLEDVVVNFFHLWHSTVHGLTDVSTENKIVRFIPDTWFDQGQQGYWTDPYGRYYLENAKEFSDMPGEWYLNKRIGRLYYYPKLGETAENLVVIAPQMSKLVIIEGSKEKPVNNVQFKGITFMHTDWNMKHMGDNEGQSHDKLGDAMIFAQYAENCLWEACEVTLGGSHGIFLDKGCKKNTVRKCFLHTLGGGGVYIGEHGWKTNYTPPAGDEVGYNIVANCIIRNLSLFFHGSCNIWIGSSNYNTITHNDISDNDYCGIHVGFSWKKNEPPTNHHNIIEKNHIHHLGRGELSDFGGIYLLGNSPGTVVRNNIVHHIKAYKIGHGIYIDNGGSNILVEGNLVYKTDHAPIFAKGDNNLIKHNIFAFSERSPMWKYIEDGDNNTPLLAWSTHFHNNIVVTHLGQDMFISNDWRLPPNSLIGNIYWDINHSDRMRFGSKTFAEWQKTGKDFFYSNVADPLFITRVPTVPEEFKLQPLSPALAIGFVEPAVSDAGVYGDAEWIKLATSFVPKYYEVVYARMGPYGDGFPPKAPDELVATATENEIQLRWKDNSNDEFGFRVFRKMRGGFFAQIAEVGANETAYTDATVAAGPTFYYRVVAFGINGESANSNEVATKIVIEDNLGKHKEENVALNKPVTGSRAIPGYEVEKAVDGDVETYWVTDQVWANQWMQVDLGQEYRLARIEIVDRMGAPWPENRRNFRVFASKTKDFSQSVLLGEQGAEDFGDDKTWVAEVEYIDTYRYIRYEKTADWEAAFAEIRVIAKVPEKAP